MRNRFEHRYDAENKYCDRCGRAFFAREIGIVYKGDCICKGCYGTITQVKEDTSDAEEEPVIEIDVEIDVDDNDWGDADDLVSDEPEEKPVKVLTPKEIVEELGRNIIGQDEAKKALAIAVFKHCKRVASGVSSDKIPKSNILMKGPTGSGKTYLLQNIAKLLDVPFCIIDASNLTAASYKGNNVDSILPELLQAADGNVAAAEKGIVYLDEFDKLSSNFDLGRNGKSGVGSAVQRQLLKLIEGCKAEVSSSLGRGTISMDTSNILFVCGGAFVDMDEKEDAAKPIGFCMDKEKKEESSVKQKATAEDFVKFGLIPEVVGRLPVIVELEKLTVEDMKKILTDSEESFMNGYHSLMSELGVELVVQDDAIEEIAKMAYDRGVGARGINAIVENIMGDIVFEVPSDPTIKKCVINKEVVTGKEYPYLVHTGGRKNSRKKNQKKMAS